MRAEEREDGGCVCRGDDGSQKDAEFPIPAEKPRRKKAGEDRGQKDAEGAEDRSGKEDFTDGTPRGIVSAGEQDENETERTDLDGVIVVVETDLAEAFTSGEHSEE